MDHASMVEPILGDEGSSEIAQVADSGFMLIYCRDHNKSVENETEIESHYLNSVFPVSPNEEDVEKNQSHKEDTVELGSFLMGWLGMVFKSNIHHFSPHLEIGLSTGYLGSLTTFSGWNQNMINLASKNHRAYAIAGIIIGLCLVNHSIQSGVGCASYLHKAFFGKFDKYKTYFEYMRVNSLKKHIMAAAVTIFSLMLLWSLCGALAGIELSTTIDGAFLWLGCLVGPPGVWARWYLVRLNGRGIGRNGSLKWLPIGTLSANIIAACLMASLSELSAAVNTKRCTIVISGIQFGFLGCLSTVSTFVAETYAMRKSGHSRRAFIYELATILPSFVLGTLIYYVPVWTKH